MSTDDHAESTKQAVLDEIYGWALDAFGLELPTSAVRFAQVVSLVTRLEDEGLDILKVGEVPPWMEKWGYLEDGGRYSGSLWTAKTPRQLQLYRLSPAKDES